MADDPPFHKQLNRELVVRQAQDLLDAEGLDALTMRRLADRLGVVPNALYRHVKDKDDLLDGVMDAAVASVPLPPPDLPWDEGLTALAASIRATMLANPAVSGLIVNRPNLGLGAIAIGEYAFGLLLGAGFAPADADRALNVVLVWTLGFVALEVPRASEPELTEAELAKAYELLPTDAFPHTATVKPNPIEIVSDSQFELGLRCLLDGLRPLAGGRTFGP
jgi:AcrR family transcriptional regulator